MRSGRGLQITNKDLSEGLAYALYTLLRWGTRPRDIAAFAMFFLEVGVELSIAIDLKLTHTGESNITLPYAMICTLFWAMQLGNSFNLTECDFSRTSTRMHFLISNNDLHYNHRIASLLCI